MVEHDVIISASEPRYWILLLGCVAIGIWAVRYFPRHFKGNRRAIQGLGLFMLSLQASDLVLSLLHPEMSFSVHRSLPLHFCGLNAILIGLNCFWMNRPVFAFTTFMGMVGGAHSVLTPQLTHGDLLPLLILFYVKHAALVFVPIVLARTTALRFRRFDWIRTYGWAVGVSTLMMGVNAVLNLQFPHPDGLIANYMYVWEAPIADNPLVFDWPWPFYLAPLHVALLAHLILINAGFRKWNPATDGGRTLKWFE